MTAFVLACLVAAVIVFGFRAIMRAIVFVIAVCILAAILSGCASRPPASPDLARVDAALAARPQIPARALTCQPEPRSPGRGADSDGVRRYIAGLIDAGDDCRRKLGVIRNVYAN